MKIDFGPGGTEGLGYEEGLKAIAAKGLSALEIEFTHGVSMKNETAKIVAGLARSYGIRLSVHAPYYINLAAKEREKQEASVGRIMDSCERGHHLGATHIVFHPGFYQGRDPEEVYTTISKHVSTMVDKVKEEGWKVQLAPEVTGKPSQFGSVTELKRLSEETGCAITVDFSHLLARYGGKVDFNDVVSDLNGFRHIHSHFSGIEWGEKGERRHVPTTIEAILPLADALKSRKFSMTIINESPQPIDDAVLMKKVFSDEGLL